MNKGAKKIKIKKKIHELGFSNKIKMASGINKKLVHKKSIENIFPTINEIIDLDKRSSPFESSFALIFFLNRTPPPLSPNLGSL
jgi:hypothetical protein